MKYNLKILCFTILALALMTGSAYTAEEMELVGEELLPPNAKAGECYARVFVPPTYKTVSETTLQKSGSDRLIIAAPQFKTVEEQIMTKEASERLEIIPAEYVWAEEQVMIAPEHIHLKEVPAVYETLLEKVIDQPAHTIWKKGKGLVQKIDNATGEIMCLVEIPATYKTITKRVLMENAHTEEIVTPAKYITVKRKVMRTAPMTVKIEIPAEYKTVKVRKMTSSAFAERQKIPEKFQTVSRRELLTEGKMEWRAVLCETNTTPGLISSLQKALQEEGYNPGPIDGDLGQRTMSAIRSYQKDNDLPVGQITHETLQSLNVNF